MPRGKARQDTDMLSMALIGYEQQKSKIDEKIREIRGLIGGTRKPADPSVSASSKPGPKKGKRTLSAEARKRIAVAQKKRWAEHRKSLGQAE